MDSRALLNTDGWPEIPDRDRLPLRWLCEGAAITSQFTQRAIAVMHNSTSRVGITALNLERDAVAYALTLPSWWHLEPSLQYSDGVPVNKKKSAGMYWGMGSAES